jgi:hypothetical protein
MPSSAPPVTQVHIKKELDRWFRHEIKKVGLTNVVDVTVASALTGIGTRILRYPHVLKWPW